MEEWKLIGHSHQIADTGDYDECYEITNGKVSIFTQDDDEDALQPIVKALNESGCKFYLDDSAQFELNLEKEETKKLRLKNESLKEKLQVAPMWVETMECPKCHSKNIKWYLSSTKECKDCGEVFRAEELIM